MRLRDWAFGLALLAGLAWQQSPAADLDPAAQLGGPELTPMGAQRRGNAAGTIPAWTGGLLEPPVPYQPGEHHPDPFPDDPLRFRIDASNLDQHADQLTAGHRALLRAHPSSAFMRVYPARRTAAYPDFVYEAVRANARSAELIVAGKGGVRGARVGPPFPIPSSALEIVWNHNLRWQGIYVHGFDGVAVVSRSGRFRVVLTQVQIGLPYASPRDTAFKRRYPNIMLAFKAKTLSPALVAGDGALILETINQTDTPRQAWRYSRGLRRVLRVPQADYDYPLSASEGLRTIDDLGLFNGPPDRYTWELLGKREVLIPYNAYTLHGGGVGPAEILGRRHLNPELPRYELHRVWVIEARLKPGARHLYARRVFYVDEDSWQIAVAETYDAEGRLWRLAEAHPINAYQVPVHATTLTVHYDLLEGRYLVSGLDNGQAARRYEDGADPREFSPNSLTYSIR